MRGISLPDDVVAYIAGKIENNTRELEGAIFKIQGESSVQNGRMDLELAKHALGDSGSHDAKRVTIQQIYEAVTKYYSVRLSDIQSKKRHKSIAFPRQVCMFLARKHTQFSLAEIGLYFGGRDHTTVMHAVKTVTEDCTADKRVAEQVNHLEVQLTA
jgi:chromosomal replication initiator protein